jgi:hypothetical protein
VGVKFNLPAGFKAVVGIGTTIGKYDASTSTTGGLIQDQTGFTSNRRPLNEFDTQFGPSEIEEKFVAKATQGSFDLQVDGNDEGSQEYPW